MTVHFDLHFDPSYTDVDVHDVEAVLLREIKLQNSSRYFVNLTIDPNSLEIQVSHTI